MNYTKVKKIINIKNDIYEMMLLVLGCFIMACGTALFLLPNQLSTGGFSGIATISYYLFKTPLGTTMFLLNVPLFILSYFRKGGKFLIKAVTGTALLGIFIDILEKFNPLTQDKFLASIYGGIIVGIGTSLVLKAVASTGGTDLLIYIIRSYKPHYQTSSLTVIIDFIIVLLNVLVFKNIEIGLYSAIAIYIDGKMIDIVFEGVNFTKIMFIISSKYEQISKEIGESLTRGSTGIYAKGMYTNEDKMMLLCAGSRSDICKIKQITLKIDNKAFIIVSNARETLGKGFRKI